jgi:hypothetical protein
MEMDDVAIIRWNNIIVHYAGMRTLDGNSGERTMDDVELLLMNKVTLLLS